MGKTSKKQRDQKRYDQELASRKEEETLRKVAALETKASSQGTKWSGTGSIKVKAGSQPTAATENKSKPTESSVRETHFALGDLKIVWQQGEPTRTLLFPGGADPAGVANFMHRFPDFFIKPGLDSQIFQDLREGKKPGQRTQHILEARGAVLVLACSQHNADNSLPYREGRNLRTDLLIPEANLLLLEKHLPLPRGVNRNELFIPLPEEDTIPWHPWHEKPQSVKSSKELDPKLEAERKVNEFRSENSELKSNLSALKAEVKEAYQARDRKEEENSELVKQISEAKVEQKEKVEKLREKNTKLKSTTPTSSPTSSSSSKSIFVVQALSKQVKDLSRELKEKNDQLAELITELTKSG